MRSPTITCNKKLANNDLGTYVEFIIAKIEQQNFDLPAVVFIDDAGAYIHMVHQGQTTSRGDPAVMIGR
jgi:hypothetical protein